MNINVNKRATAVRIKAVAAGLAEGFLRRAVGVDRRSLAAARYREPHRRSGAGARRTGGAAGEFARGARLGGYSQSRCTRRKPAAGDHVDLDGARIPKAVMS